MRGLKVELHLLQNFPPSCLNRDDTNTPKTCEFGGVTRARVSSQCWKRAIREYFREIAPERYGTRSKRLKVEVVNRLSELGVGTPETLDAPITKFITIFYAAMDKKRTDETTVPVFYSPAEFNTIVEILADSATLEEFNKKDLALNKREIGEIKRRLKQSQLAPDVALFARMLADHPDMNVDAACQVAHAISTHGVNVELDFFTAIDDLKQNDESDAGASMLGTVGYDSACYYRYALVDYKQLLCNLNGSREDTDAALAAFLEAFCYAVPGAKRNSFAHSNPPFLALFVVRQSGVPASLVNAFAVPVNARNGNLLQDSANALAKQARFFAEKYELYEDAQLLFFHALDTAPAMIGIEKTKLRELIAATLNSVRECAGELA
ncbi:MAG: type I-E CRISPR-associated protein Cas7/Cse4/CasC [Candidatus Hadarchaeum sp.]